MPVRMTITEDGAVPVKIWTEDIDEKSVRQLQNVAKLPFVFLHVAAMPDVHVGMGATVGSVIATDGAVIPAAVGVDIGCGMLAARTNLRKSDTDEKSLKAAMAEILRRTPVGLRQHKDKNIHQEACEPFAERIAELQSRIPGLLSKMRSMTWQGELGTLGGGNHFLELTADGSGTLWIMLHTGSRGAGNCMASHFIARAKKEAALRGTELPDPALAFFEEGTEDFALYMDCAAWAQDYAMANRGEILKDTVKSLGSVWPGIALTGEVFNCHHNYVARETHFGRPVWVTRKGAIRAGRGQMGIIPGSMGTASYLVEGLGNPESFCSSSHGAGRALSRTAAKARFTLEELAAQTAGVVCRRDAGVLDEIPAAYKDIDAVMANQTDLVRPVQVLKQVLCVKG